MSRNVNRLGKMTDGKWEQANTASSPPRAYVRKVKRVYHNEMKRQAKRITVALQWQKFLTNPYGSGIVVLRNGRQVVLNRGTTEGIYIERSFAKPLRHYPGHRSARLAKRQAVEV